MFLKPWSFLYSEQLWFWVSLDVQCKIYILKQNLFNFKLNTLPFILEGNKMNSLKILAHSLKRFFAVRIHPAFLLRHNLIHLYDKLHYGLML